jgi:hypothetical protein
VTWTYDAAYQLINEDRSGANAYNTTYVYDPVGNRLVKNEDGALMEKNRQADSRPRISFKSM